MLLAKYNYIDSLAQRFRPQTFLPRWLTHGSNSGWMPFMLSPIIHMVTSRSCR